MSRLIGLRRHVVLPAVMVMSFGACSSSDDSGADASGPQAVRVVADDASWETSGMSGLRAGWVSFTLETREGEADHGLALLRLKGDATVDELVQVEDFEQFLELVEPIGGLVGVTGAASHTVTSRLDAGSYAIIDFGETEAGPNFLRGMTASFDVAGGDGTAGVRPESDGEIVMREFAIDVPDGFTGHGTYLVRNDGGLFHELNIGRFDRGIDPVEVIRVHAETGRGEGAEEVPGMWVLAPGEEAYLELDLAPGPHAFVRFLSDPEDQPSHALRGMYALFTVD
jgi:hypothetical protein